MTHHQNLPKISLEELRVEIKKEYTNVALDPTKGYHFHTGRRAAKLPNATIHTLSEPQVH